MPLLTFILQSVVAALADPDTIILRRSWDDKLSILDKQIGEKKLKIVLKGAKHWPNIFKWTFH